MEHTREVSLRYCKLLIERKECPKALAYDQMKPVFDAMRRVLTATHELLNGYESANNNEELKRQINQALAHAKALEEK